MRFSCVVVPGIKYEMLKQCWYKMLGQRPDIGPILTRHRFIKRLVLAGMTLDWESPATALRHATACCIPENTRC